MKRAEKTWTRDKVEALHRDYLKSSSVHDVTLRHNISGGYMYALFRAHGLSSRQGLGVGLRIMACVSREELSAAYSDYRKGDTKVCDIAARFGVSASTLYKVFRRCGYDVPLHNSREERSRIHTQYPRGRAMRPIISDEQALKLFEQLKRPDQSLADVANSAYISTGALKNAFARCGLDWRPYLKHNAKRRKV